ncbi:hypothetical protein [Pseudophaeobacter sp. EL27]|uniref:hypothetical protein n=1 Tax=Pseudophaeobacter sp. EL27 TaxID=2107580 RepID=UPI000EFB5477|nr:hypothetical protein [Pseudophaeobacter sp. EL27]
MVYFNWAEFLGTTTVNVVIFAFAAFLFSLPFSKWNSDYAKPAVVCATVFLIFVMMRLWATIQSVADGHYDVPEAVLVLLGNYSLLSIAASGALVFGFWVLLNVGPDEDKDASTRG